MGAAQQIFEYMRFKREERYVTIVYLALIGIIVASPFLESFVPSTYVRMIELMFVVIAFLGVYSLKRMQSLVGYQGWSKFLIFLLLVSCIQIICRNEWSECGSLKDKLLLGLSWVSTLPYLLPFAVLFLPNERHIDRICNIFFYSALFTVPIWILNSTILVQDAAGGENIGAWLPLLGCFVMVYPSNLSKFKKLILWCIWAVYLLLMILNARRQMCFTLGFYAVIWVDLIIARYLRSRLFRLIIFSAVVAITGLYLYTKADELSDNAISSRLVERIDEDTRSKVELYFWADFITSTIEEQAFGRGGSGAYYQEVVDVDTNEITTDRPVVETGYLMMLLKGGYFHLVGIVLLILTALIRSFVGKNEDSLVLFLLFLLFIICNYTSSFICLYYPHSIVFWLCLSLALHKRSFKYDDNSIYHKSHKWCSK